MKKLVLSLSFVFIALLLSAQNGVYLFGFLQNAPGTPVDVHFQVNTEPITEITLVAQADGTINTTWLTLPNMVWNSIEATFTNCSGNEVTVINNYSPNNLPIDAGVLLNYCEDEVVLGCTDSLSINFNPQATVDDGSCIYPDCEIEIATYFTEPCNQFGFSLYSILDSVSVIGGVWTINGEYYSDYDTGIAFTANTSGVYEICFEGWTPFCDSGVFSCTTIEVPEGCFEEICPEAITNYDPIDCFAVIQLVNIDPAETVAWYINGEGPNYHSGPWTYPFTADGTYEFCALFEVEGCTALEYCSIVYVANCGPQPIYGCTDPNALNYNPEANIDNGTCIYETASNDLCANAQPLQIGTFIIDNSQAFLNEDIWGDCWNSGGGEGEQTSIWFSFTTPDEPAAIDIIASSDGTGTLTDTQFGLFLECGGEMIQCDGNSGQGLYSAFHFECGELLENTEYLLMIDGYFGDSGTCLLSYEVSYGCDSLVYGCMDPNAINYNPLANIDDGSCQYEEDCNVDIVVTSSNCYTFAFCAYPQDSNVLIPGAWSVNGEIYDTWNYVAQYAFDAPGTYEVCFETVIEGCDNTITECTLVTVDENCFGVACPELVIVPDSSCGAWHYIEGGAPNSAYQWYFGDNTSTIATSPVYHQYSEEGYFKTCIAYEPTDFCDVQEICAYVQINCSEEIIGCMDPNALNFNPDATIDDGSCEYWDDCLVEIMLDSINCNTFILESFVPSFGSPVDGLWFVNNELLQENSTIATFVAPESGTYEICFESFFMPNCTQNAFTCISINVSEDCFEVACPELFVETDSCMLNLQLLNVNPNQVIAWFVNGEGPNYIAGPWAYSIPSDGYYDVCALYEQEGCDIFEYCAWGQSDDCITDIYGCMDPSASNYNPDATIDDGSCEYSFECNVGFSVIFGEFGENTITIIPDEEIQDALEVLWTFGDGSSSTEMFPVHEYEGSGPYTLCLSITLQEPNGGSYCQSTFCVTLTTEMLEAAGIGSDGFIVNITSSTGSLGTNDEGTAGEINIWPNPGNDVVNFKMTTLRDVNYTLSVIDISGKIVHQESIYVSNGVGLTTLDVSELSTGMYVVSVQNNESLLTKRFVVSH